MKDFFSSYVEGLPRPLPTDSAGGAKFWRTDSPILDATGNRVLKGGFFPSQRRAWELENFIKVFVGGFGSGKTRWLGKRAIWTSLKNSPSPSMIVAPSFPMASRTIVPTMKDLLAGKKGLLGANFSWAYNKTSHEFHISYGAREALIYIASSEDVDSIRGSNIGAGFMDEPFIQPEEAFRHLVARVRDPAATIREVCLAGTPEQFNWGWELVEGELREQFKDIGVVHASTREIPFLADYVKRLEGILSKKAIEAYIDGDFINISEGQVYYAFDPREHLVRSPVPPNAELGLGLDFNVDPMAGTVFWKLGNRMHYFEEIELPNADTQELCETVRATYGTRLKMVYPDASGAARSTAAVGGISDFTTLERYGFTIQAHSQNPLRRDRFNSVNGKFKPASGRVSLTIDPSLTKLKRYLLDYTHEKEGKVAGKRMSHLLDAFSYPIAYLYPVDRETLTTSRVAVRGI